MQYVRARIDLEQRAGAGRAGRRGQPHRRASTSCSSPSTGEQGFVARQKPVTLGEVVGDDYVVRGGLKAGRARHRSNLQKIGDGAPVKPS